jgi:hypothetical protein
MDGFLSVMFCKREPRVATDTGSSGLWIPFITPFYEGKVGRQATTKLVKRLGADGIKGMSGCNLPETKAWAQELAGWLAALVQYPRRRVHHAIGDL